MLTETGLWKCTDAVYFADYGAISNSMLSAFEISPAVYHGRYVTRTVPDDVTDAMRRGSAFHKAMEFFGDGRVPFVALDCDRRTKAGKEAYEVAQLEAASLGIQVVTGEEAKGFYAMAANVAAHPIAGLLLKHGTHREIGLRWFDPATGIECKAKPDLITRCEIAGKRVVVDYKSAMEPYPDVFGRSVARFKYHRQAAHYTAGVEAVLGSDRGYVFALVVVGSEPPHEVFVYVFDEADVARGKRERDRLLGEMNHRINSGDWSHPAAGGVNVVKLPAWSKEQGADL
jgi:exodeoxyribonuclease VIII